MDPTYALRAAVWRSALGLALSIPLFFVVAKSLGWIAALAAVIVMGILWDIRCDVLAMKKAVEDTNKLLGKRP